MKQASSSAQIYGRLLGYVKPYRWAFALAIFGNILYGLVDAGFVKLFEPLLNEGFVSKKPSIYRLDTFYRGEHLFGERSRNLFIDLLHGVGGS